METHAAHLRLGKKRLRQTRLFFLLGTPSILLALFLLLFVLNELFLLLENLELLLVAGLVVDLELGFVQLCAPPWSASLPLSAQATAKRTRLSGRPQSTASRL